MDMHFFVGGIKFNKKNNTITYNQQKFLQFKKAAVMNKTLHHSISPTLSVYESNLECKATLGAEYIFCCLVDVEHSKTIILI